MAQSRLHAVYELGQSIWYDNIRRSVITSGELRRLMDQDAVVGVTSNPTIFEKAIDGSTDYDEAIKSLVSRGVTEGKAVFEALAIEDIQAAADILRPIYDRTRGHDGFISLEVSPGAAHSTRETIAEARRLWQRVNRPNVMIKIPATAEGIPGHRAYDLRGRQHQCYADLRARRLCAGGAGVHSWAGATPAGGPAAGGHRLGGELLRQPRGYRRGSSCSTSRSPRRAIRRDRRELRDLKGKAAIANAKLAYAAYKDLFRSERFERLRAAGATTQRCLWASTSTKNPDYRDVMYVEAADRPGDGQHDAAADHRRLSGSRRGARHAGGRPRRRATRPCAAWRRPASTWAQVTKQLEIDGRQVLRRLVRQADRQHGGEDPRACASRRPPHAARSTPRHRVASRGRRHRREPRQPPARDALGAPAEVDAALDRAERDHFARARLEERPRRSGSRIPPSRARSPIAWAGSTVTEQMRDALPRLRDLRDDVRAAGHHACRPAGHGRQQPRPGGAAQDVWRGGGPA